MVREARALVRRYGAALIHANDTGPLPALVAAARAERVPLVSHLHLIGTPVERRWVLLHQATLVVGVSRATVEGVLADGMPPERVAVIYNAVDTDRLAQGSARGLRAELGIAPDAAAVAVVASLIPRKGVEVVIDALAHLRGAGRDAHLLVCGDGPDEPALRARAARLGLAAAVHFLGVRADVGAVLRDASDVLASAARLEAFPLNLLEAAACGVPVVVSDIAPHREAVLDGETGVVFPLDDSAAAAAALLALADDPARRRRMGAAARARVAAHFALPGWIAEFERTYAGLLARPRRELGWIGGSTWPPVYTAWLRQSIGRRLGRRAGQPGAAANGGPDAGGEVAASSGDE